MFDFYSTFNYNSREFRRILMANTKSAKKRVVQTAKRTARNTARKSRIKTFIKKFLSAVAGGDSVAIKAAFLEAQSEIQKGVSKGVLHKNTAARKISKLHCLLKKTIAE